MILIFCRKKIFIKWFSHANRLIKSGLQFVFKILHYIIRLIRYQTNLTRFLHQVCLTGKSDENDYLYVHNTETHEKPNQTPKMALFANMF